MSSQDVIKSAAKKLKYYMEVKRLENAFDTSGADKPKRHYPTLKPRPTLLYDGLHDRALKHYFRSPEVKKALNNMNPRPSQHERESKIRKDVDNYMTRTKITTNPYSTIARPRTSPKKRKNAFKGGPILMRSRHGPYLSKGETERLVNAATKLLLASSGDERAPSRGDDEETVADKDEKEDTRQLLVRQKSFHEQQTRMSSEGKSFLEMIQDEIAGDVEQQA